jgi:hypothetical protein
MDGGDDSYFATVTQEINSPVLQDFTVRSSSVVFPLQVMQMH